MCSDRWYQMGLMQAAGADLTLSAFADVYRPESNAAYTATLEFAGIKYAEDVLFRSISSLVRATGGSPNSLVSVSWRVKVGFSEGNDGVALDEGILVQFDSSGEWQRTPDIAGSADVSVGQKHAVADAEVWVSRSQNRDHDTDTNVFSVITQQQGGAGGGGGGPDLCA